MLEFDNVACVRGGRVLFEHVSFALPAGEAMIVLGPNGVGKSSLLRLAAGLLTPAAGRVIASVPVALADERPALDAALPLGRALAFWSGAGGGDTRDALAAVGMEHLSAVPVRMLSTGQRRRASLARTLTSGAPLWLLDEPSNGLDAVGITMLEGLIVAHRLRGGSVVVATHMPLAVADARRLELGS